MEISLTPRMDQWITEKVDSGTYISSSEVILEGLRLLMRQEEQRQAMVEDLRREILIGIRQLDSGRSVVFDQSVVEKIKGESRNRLAP
ncbi:MAG: type II toxin-antitoxin system ParD family antitoxin [Deltaproteobacteria bacterium]|nr:type II toxin-antitoxin system ParD family antitoxin [Deltaproteobacteria bacterium]